MGQGRVSLVLLAFAAGKLSLHSVHVTSFNQCFSHVCRRREQMPDKGQVKGGNIHCGSQFGRSVSPWCWDVMASGVRGGWSHGI